MSKISNIKLSDKKLYQIYRNNVNNQIKQVNKKLQKQRMEKISLYRKHSK